MAYVLGGLQGTRTRWGCCARLWLFWAVVMRGPAWSWVCTCDYVSMSSLFAWMLLGDWGSWVALCHLLWNWHLGGGFCTGAWCLAKHNPVLHMTLSNPSTRKRGFLAWTRGTPG